MFLLKLKQMWPWQVSPWTYRASTCAPCSPRTSTIFSDTRAPWPRRPATRASSGPCLTPPSLCRLTRYKELFPSNLFSHNEPVCLRKLIFSAQIRKLESTLMDIDNKTLWNDYRVAQPLNDRNVESSFLPRLGKGSEQCRCTTGKYNLFFRI